MNRKYGIFSFTLTYLLIFPYPFFLVAQTSPIVYLEYQRADSMWAKEGDVSSSLGLEVIKNITLGKRIEFDTDWKHEKKKNDGVKYFGSHLRFAENKGNVDVLLFVRPALPGHGDAIRLTPGMKYRFKNDLIAVEVSKSVNLQSSSAQRCILEYERADNPDNPAGLPSNSLGIETVSLRLGERIKFETDWKFAQNRGTDSLRYGSHMRKVRMSPDSETSFYMDIRLRRAPLKLGSITPDEVIRLFPGTTTPDKADIVEISCYRR